MPGYLKTLIELKKTLILYLDQWMDDWMTALFILGKKYICIYAKIKKYKPSIKMDQIRDKFSQVQVTINICKNLINLYIYNKTTEHFLFTYLSIPCICTSI